MQGVLRTSGKPAKIKLRATVKGLPAGAEIEITDFMFQPDQAVSGWLPHVTELPWSAGMTYLNTAPGGELVYWDNVQEKPVVFPPSIHKHAIGDVTGLRAELDALQSGAKSSQLAYNSKHGSDLPGTYPAGYSVGVFSVADGWPSGPGLGYRTVVTFRDSGFGGAAAAQYAYPYQRQTSPTLYRTAVDASSWGAWNSLGGGGGFSDSVAPPTEMTTYHWAGAAHASHSMKRVDGVEAGKNLLINGSAENGTTAWAASNTTTFSSTTGHTTMAGRVEARIFELRATTAAAVTASMAQEVSATPGRWYALRAWVASEGSKAIIRPRIEWLNASGAVISASTHPEFNANFYEGGYFTMTAAAPTGAVTARIMLSIYQANAQASGARLWADQIMVTEGATQAAAESSAETYFDGNADWETSLWLDRGRSLKQWDGAAWGSVA